MATETLKKLEVPERVSEHPGVGVRYTSPAGEISYSDMLVRAALIRLMMILQQKAHKCPLWL
jgi:hypothetical protein